MYKVLDAKQRKPVPFYFNEAQIVLHKRVRQFQRRNKPVRIVTCKSRRAGISSGVEALMYHDTTTNANTSSLIVGNQRGPSENVLRMCKRFWESTPEKIAGIPFRPRLPDSYRASWPRDRVEFPDLDSEILIGSAKSVDQYLSFGFQNIHATEVAYYDAGHDLFRALMPTLTNDAHSMLVMESTPAGKVGKGRYFFEQVMSAKDNDDANNWEHGAMHLVFVPWWEMRVSFALPFRNDAKRAAFAKSLSGNELDTIKRFPGLALEQMLWRRSTLAGPPFNNDEDFFDQEYPSDLATAFLSTGTTVFGRKHIKRLMSRTREPIWRGDVYFGASDKANYSMHPREFVRKPMFMTRGEAQHENRKPHTNERTYNNLKVWRWPVKGDRVFICGDVCGGDPDTKNGDYSTLAVGVLNDYEQDELIMTWRGHLNPLAFAEVACALAWAILSRVGEDVVAPMLAIEWNGPGVACNTYLDDKNLYPHTYRYVHPSVHGQKKTNHIGWESNDKTKPMMVKYTQRHIQMDLIDIPDEGTIEEMASYRQTDGYGGAGSFEGDAGVHDDRVTALEILVVLLRYAAGSNDAGAVSEIIDIYDFEDGDTSWDPFDNPTGEFLDLDGESDEGEQDETMFYSAMHA